MSVSRSGRALMRTRRSRPTASPAPRDSPEEPALKLTSREVELVRADWKKVAPASQAALTMFYERLFQIEFKLRVLFRSDPEQQKRRLSQVLEHLLAHASDLEPVLPMLRALGRRHRVSGVRAEDYDTAGGALLWTLGHLLGHKFDVEHQSAWLRLYRGIAKVMVEAADGRTD